MKLRPPFPPEARPNEDRMHFKFRTVIAIGAGSTRVSGLRKVPILVTDRAEIGGLLVAGTVNM